MMYVFNLLFSSANTSSSTDKLGAQTAAKQHKKIFLPTSKLACIFLNVSIFCATSEINLSTDALVAWMSLMS